MSTQTQNPYAALPTGTWRIDPAQTKVSVAVRKLGLFTIIGDLTVTDGTISLDGTTAKIDVTADAASYASPMAKRDEHVQSVDFLDVGQFPTIRFTGETLTSDATGDRHVAGELTVKGQTAPVDFRVVDIDAGADTASFTATATVDRTALGLNKMPSFVIGKTLDITVSAHAAR